MQKTQSIIMIWLDPNHHTYIWLKMIMNVFSQLKLGSTSLMYFLPFREYPTPKWLRRLTWKFPQLFNLNNHPLLNHVLINLSKNILYNISSLPLCQLTKMDEKVCLLSLQQQSSQSHVTKIWIQLFLSEKIHHN